MLLLTIDVNAIVNVALSFFVSGSVLKCFVSVTFEYVKFTPRLNEFFILKNTLF